MKTPRTGNTEKFAGIFQKIRESRDGVISFAEFMEWALYHPDEGYYRDADAGKIGKTGDFFTSVSVGESFGMLLAWEIERCWRERLGAPESFTVVEQGAHDGRLALDILESLKEKGSELAEKVRYCIIEPDAARRQRLSERLGDHIRVVAEAGEIRDSCGMFLCNELLDAFPVHRARFDGEAWEELGVTVNEGGNLAWQTRGLVADSALSRELSRIGTGFPVGYTTEICLEVADWIRSVAALFDRGIWWIVDYGFEEDEYFAARRTGGTLQCYRDHRVIEDPFESPGETDITAHVNFSQLSRLAGDAGLDRKFLADQHDFLTRAAAPWLMSLESDGTSQHAENRKRLRQFQTLTHPGMMGRVFKVAEFSRGL